MKKIKDFFEKIFGRKAIFVPYNKYHYFRFKGEERDVDEAITESFEIFGIYNWLDFYFSCHVEKHEGYEEQFAAHRKRLEKTYLRNSLPQAPKLATHSFLTHYLNTRKFAYVYPHTMIFYPLFELVKSRGMSNYAVIVFEEDFSFIAFYRRGGFSFSMTLDYGWLGNLRSLGEEERDALMGRILKDGRIAEAIGNYESEIIFYFNDEFNFHKKLTMPTINLQKLYPDLNQLARLSKKYLSKEHNLARNIFASPTLWTFVGTVFFTFLIIFSTSMIKDYLLMRENYKINTENRNNFELFESKKKELNKLNQELQNKIKNEGDELEKNEKFLGSFELRPFQNKVKILETILLFLNEKQLKISSLKLAENRITLQLFTQQEWDKILSIFNEGDEFVIVDSNKEDQTVSLEAKNNE